MRWLTKRLCICCLLTAKAEQNTHEICLLTWNQATLSDCVMKVRPFSRDLAFVICCTHSPKRLNRGSLVVVVRRAPPASVCLSKRRSHRRQQSNNGRHRNCLSIFWFRQSDDGRWADSKKVLTNIRI